MYDFILANFAMHISLDASEIEQVKTALHHRRVKKNELLLKSGNICRNIYFVEKGCLRIFNTDNEGEEHTTLFCPENWWAVDIASFSSQTPAFYTIGTLKDTEVFYFSYTELEKLYLQVPKMERFFRILTQNGFNLYQRRMTSNLSKTAEERYMQFQKQYPKLENHIAQKNIASYLGITTVFLSMIRSRKRH